MLPNIRRGTCRGSPLLLFTHSSTSDIKHGGYIKILGVGQFIVEKEKTSLGTTQEIHTIHFRKY
jgi:hypothetical protein